MDWTSFLLELLKLTIPALVVFLVTYLTMKQFLENDLRKKQLEQRRKNAGELNPLKVQAYERMVLYLERINPSAMLLRLNVAQLTASQLKSEMNHAISDEFNHNLSQQLFISPQGWKIIRMVKDQMIQFNNQCFEMLPEGSSGFDLSKLILETIVKNEEVPTDKAIDFLKKEFKLMFD